MKRQWQSVETHLGDPYDDSQSWGHVRRSAFGTSWRWKARRQDGTQGEGKVETEADAMEAVEHFLGDD